MSERNDALLRKVGDTIANEPERYNQVDYLVEYGCGTTACIAGHTLLIAYGTVYGDPDSDDRFVHEVAAGLLGLTDEEAWGLFGCFWEPAGVEPTDSHERRAELVRDALYRLADGAAIDEVTA